jgi:L-lysine 2,3-aminomutase
VRSLRGWISGLAVPQLVREDRRGRREVIVPQYIESLEPHRVTVRNYSGERHEYLNPGGEPP